MNKLALIAVSIVFVVGCGGRKELQGTKGNSITAANAVVVEGLWVKQNKKKFDFAYRLKNISTNKLGILSTNFSCLKGTTEGQLTNNILLQRETKAQRTAGFQDYITAAASKPDLKIKIDLDNENSAEAREAARLRRAFEGDPQRILLYPNETKTFRTHCELYGKLHGEPGIKITSIFDVETGKVIVPEVSLYVNE